VSRAASCRARRRNSVRSPWLEVRGELPPWAYKGLVALGFASLFFGWWWLSGQSWINPVFVPAPNDAGRYLVVFELLAPNGTVLNTTKTEEFSVA